MEQARTAYWPGREAARWQHKNNVIGKKKSIPAQRDAKKKTFVALTLHAMAAVVRNGRSVRAVPLIFLLLFALLVQLLFIQVVLI